MTAIAIFDLDNTLVHSRIDFAAIRRDVTEFLRENGATAQTLEQLGHLSIGQIIGIGEGHDARIGTQLGPACWRIVLEYERQGMQAATVEPDAAPTLTQLRESGWKLAVLTNNARPATLDALCKFELEPLFDLILTRDEVEMKPAPGGIQHAMAHFRATRGVMVGDAWLDGKAAESAGIPFIAFGPVLEKLRQRDVPVWRNVKKLGELVDVLGNDNDFGIIRRL